MPDLVGDRKALAHTGVKRVDPDSQRTIVLLDATQLIAWRCHQRFWVEVPGGVVEFGQLYELRYRPLFSAERQFCVVPEDHKRLLAADIWTNLLLIYEPTRRGSSTQRPGTNESLRRLRLQHAGRRVSS